MKGRAGGSFLCAAVTLLVALPGLPTASASPFVQPLPWWNSIEPDEGYHLRVLVNVTNPYSYPVTNAPVAVELDLARLLSDAGWPRLNSPGRPQLKAFQLDPDSLRVVPLNALDLPPGLRGTNRTADVRHPASDPRRYEEPSTHFEGSLRGSIAGAYDPRTNPYVTVVWRVGDRLDSGAVRPYMVYFDILDNEKKPAPSYNATKATAALQALFWSTPGLTLYGTVAAPTTASVGLVTVAAFQPNTTVTVWAADATGNKAGLFERVNPPQNQGFPPNPFTLQAEQSVRAYVATGTQKVVRIEASKPVLAFGLSTGFVPSLDGGAVGTEFLFALTEPTIWEQDTVYFIGTSNKPTIVEVRRIQDGVAGETYTFPLNSGTALPYTRGSRSGGSQGPSTQCQPQQAPGASPLLPKGPGLFRARVLEGGDPVLLQLQNLGGLVQVPAADGSPAGTVFQAATAWSDERYRFGGGNQGFQCVGSHHSGYFVAGSVGALGASSKIAVTSADSAWQIYPPGSEGDKFPKPDPLPVAPQVTDPKPVTAVRDRPIHFAVAGEPVHLFVGHDPPVVRMETEQGLGEPSAKPVQAGRTVVNGPLFGSGVGRQFVCVGPTLAVAPFPDTHINATLHHSDGSKPVVHQDLGPGGILRLDDPSSVTTLRSCLIKSNKPVFAYPLGATPGAFAGIPAFLEAHAGGADFRGHLVRIAPTDGKEPVAGLTAAGPPITYLLKVANLGRGPGGANLPDAVTVSLEDVDPSWEATLQGGQTSVTYNLQTGEERDIELTVRNVTAKQEGDITAFRVVATSGGNPQVKDQLPVFTKIRSSFALGLWFDDPSRPTFKNGGTTSPGEGRRFDLVLQNQGTEADTIGLRIVDEQILRPWTARLETSTGLLPEGGLRLEPGQVMPLRLFVSPPATFDAQAVLALVRVTASSGGNAAESRTATAQLTLRQASDLRLNVPVTGALVPPGHNADFEVILENRAAGPASQLEFQLRSDAIAGWPAPILVPSSGDKLITVVPGLVDGTPGRANLTARIRVPFGEEAGRLMTLHFLAKQPDKPTLEAFLQVRVGPGHALRVDAPSLTAAPEGGGNLTLPIAVANRGNLNESLTPLPASVPSGWGLHLPKLVVVLRNQSAFFPAVLSIPPETPAGFYPIAFRLVSADGNATEVRLEVQVGAVGTAATGPAHGNLAQPGTQAVAEFPVRNDGNTPLTLTLSPASGERWSLATPPPPLILAPGASVPLRVAWHVPRNEPAGNTTHRVLLTLTPSDGLATTTQRELSTSFLVGRSDAAVASVRAFPGAAGTLVAVEVANRGDRDAQNLVVQLQSGSRVIANATLATLAPGAIANVTLLLPRDVQGEARIVLDPQDAIVEHDKSNNAALVPLGSQKAPLPAVFALLFMLVALAALRRRRP